MRFAHRSLAAAGLALALSAAGAAQGGAAGQEELDSIRSELRAESEQLGQLAKEADSPDARSELYRSYREEVLPEFAARFAQLARSQPGNEVGLAAWTEVIELASNGYRGALAKEALGALVRDHADSEKLAPLASNLRWIHAEVGTEEAVSSLRALAGASPHRAVRAAALYSLGAVLGEDRPAGDARIAEAKVEFAKLAAYADLELYEGRSYAAAAEAFVFALDNLSVGLRCPDFEAFDAEGARFRLSDYAGKVVLLDFWGFW
jgi:hypothetical protein